MEEITIHIAPITIKVDDAEATIWEAIKVPTPTERPQYLCTVSIRWRGFETRRFTLPVKDEKDLERKLKIELTKLKIAFYTYGGEQLRRMLTTP